MNFLSDVLYTETSNIRANVCCLDLRLHNRFVQKNNKNNYRVAMTNMTWATQACVQCWSNYEYFMLEQCFENIDEGLFHACISSIYIF